MNHAMTSTDLSPLPVLSAPATITVDWQQLLRQLAEPFPASVIQWRAGSTTKDKSKAQALPYAEPRVYEDRLNTICPGHWEVSFEPWGDRRIICRLTIYGITRASTGEEGDSPNSIAGTAAEAQAFKRACSRFGLGRYLYDLPVQWVAYDKETKRLLQTPKLAVAALPVPAPTHHVTETPASPVLDRQRASALHIELARLKVNRSEHYSFAANVLKREITSFVGLTEAEAKLVYGAARRALSNQM